MIERACAQARERDAVRSNERRIGGGRPIGYRRAVGNGAVGGYVRRPCYRGTIGGYVCRGR